MTALWVAAGAAAGGALRYAVTSHSRRVPTFPGGTLGIAIVNAVGTLLLAVFTRWHLDGTLPPNGLALLGVGFCGALTTWSSLALDCAEMVLDRRFRASSLNLAANVAAGGAGGVLGWWLAGLA